MLTAHHQQSGFTLVELIITIVLGGIVAAMTTSVLTLPINAYIDTASRASLTDIAESSLRRMQRDIHSALPNSIRVTNGGKTLELLHLIDGGRYRTQQDTSVATVSNILDFTQIDTGAETLGSLQNFSNITLGTDRLVIYPVDASGAYSGANTATLNAGSTANLLVFTKQFPLPSPQQRFFIIDKPITYHCELAAVAAKDKLLMRYENYGVLNTQVIPPASPLDVSGAIQANYLDECNFDYNSGSSTRSGLITLTLKFTDEKGESVRLIHQVHVNNQP